MPGTFHEGELEAQRLAGETLTAEMNGTMIAGRVMRGALPFLAEQSMVVFGSGDREGRPWASILFGMPGFLSSADGHSVQLDFSTVPIAQYDPFWRNIEANPSVGMLAIDLATRRRIRINGQISRPTPTTLEISVREAYPNCPKYITRRVIESAGASASPGSEVERGKALGLAQQGLVRGADVLFLATAHPARGADVSHRGGHTGFIEVLDGQTLRIPDYPGNSMFNSFGNLLVHPAAGLLIPNFESRRLLQLTGTAEVLFGAPDPEDATAGTQRFLVFKVAEWLQYAMPAALESKLVDYSPYNPGNREDGARR